MADNVVHIFENRILATSRLAVAFIIFTAYIAFLRYNEDLYIKDTFFIMIFA